jgi:hypothetical protein
VWKSIFLLAGILLFDEKSAQGSASRSPNPFRIPQLYSKHRSTVSAFFGDQFVGKENGLHTDKPSSKKLGAFLY